jgi:hypothetical protein
MSHGEKDKSAYKKVARLQSEEKISPQLNDDLSIVKISIYGLETSPDKFLRIYREETD